MQDILIRLQNSSTNESSHELQCRCIDAADEIKNLRRVIEANADGHRECLDENRRLRESIDWALAHLDEDDGLAADLREAMKTPNGQA